MQLAEKEVEEIRKIKINNLKEISSYYKRYMKALERKEELDHFYFLVESLNKTSNIDQIRKQNDLFEKLYKTEYNSQQKGGTK